ncbi:hypothetical protein [Amantichitinum ursilacus]|uniref:Uncharacterized protein n=1 Tax=Amantichitinum ursilacus TaxID=857265 RepID=A0A0N0XJU1_9NEIS|nr:hypothetical protein [Amantichitinum ursilacus]KPC54059.1 hypothetical protein WG78_05400 [Amantichitinum ursilacus]
MAISIPFFGKIGSDIQSLAPNTRVNRASALGEPERIDGIVLYQVGKRAKVCWGPGKSRMEPVDKLVMIVE